MPGRRVRDRESHALRQVRRRLPDNLFLLHAISVHQYPQENLARDLLISEAVALVTLLRKTFAGTGQYQVSIRIARTGRFATELHAQYALL